MTFSLFDPWVQTVLVAIPVTVVIILTTDLLGWAKRRFRGDRRRGRDQPLPGRRRQRRARRLGPPA